MTDQTQTISPPWMEGFTPAPPKPMFPAKASSQFKPGQSGNPLGRPKGSKNRRTVLLEQLQDAGQEITQLVIDKAREGDLSAAALVLQRLVPPLKPSAQTVTFTLDKDATLLEQASSVLAAVAEGILDPDSGKMLIGCLSTMSDLKVSELTERLAAIEEKLVLRGLR
jgi:hypothetical protein